MSNTIITIGRQYGSAGRLIGKKLSEELGIKMYDREMLTEAAKNSEICEELFQTHDEKPTNSFLYSLVMDTYSMGYSSRTYDNMPLNHKIFLAQFDAIKKIAERESCILVGRCADYVLEDYENCSKIFIYADLETRIDRVSAKHDLSYSKAKERITKTDKQRASYYNYYTNKRWGAIGSYDLCINSSILGVDGTAKFLGQYVENRKLHAKENQS